MSYNLLLFIFRSSPKFITTSSTAKTVKRPFATRAVLVYELVWVLSYFPGTHRTSGGTINADGDPVTSA